MVFCWSDYVSDAKSFTSASTTITTFQFTWFTLDAHRQPLLTKLSSDFDSVVAQNAIPLICVAPTNLRLCRTTRLKSASDCDASDTDKSATLMTKKAPVHIIEEN